MPFPDTFATARLTAERLRLDHLAEIRRMDADPDFMGLLGGPRDLAKTEAYIARNLQHWDEYHFGLWVLRDAADARVIGRAVLRHLLIEDQDEVEVGYAFFKEYWGRGLATEIAAACIVHGRDLLKQPSLVALTRAENIGSQRVMEKAGMRYDRDVTRDGLQHVLFRITFPR